MNILSGDGGDELKRAKGLMLKYHREHQHYHTRRASANQLYEMFLFDLTHGWGMNEPKSKFDKGCGIESLSFLPFCMHDEITPDYQFALRAVRRGLTRAECTLLEVEYPYGSELKRIKAAYEKSLDYKESEA